MSTTHASSLEKAAAIASWIQTVAVVISLIFIIFQLNQQIALSRAANASAFVRLGQPLNLRLTESDMARVWLKREKAAENKTDVSEAEVEEVQFNSMLANYLAFYENVYVQYELELVEKKFFDLWDKDLEHFVAIEPMEKHWANSRDAYQEVFRTRVDELLKQKPNPPVPTPTAPGPGPATP